MMLQKPQFEVNAAAQAACKLLLHATAHIFNKQVLKVYRVTLCFFFAGQLDILWEGSFRYTSVTARR